MSGVWVIVAGCFDEEPVVCVEFGYFTSEDAARKHMRDNNLSSRQEADAEAYAKALRRREREKTLIAEYKRLLEQGVDPVLLRARTDYGDPVPEQCTGKNWWEAVELAPHGGAT